ncbi:MAG: Hpt domain-containing protein [Gammaproteobacteria bacterium]|nr:Hpt domain-containing protein [Gammaproteobacteria bacterium]
MTSADFNIDDNLYQLYQLDATVHIENLNKIFTTADDKLNPEDLEQAVKLLQSINSGAQIAALPFIPAICESLSQLFINALKSNAMSNEVMLSEFNYETIQAVIDHLQQSLNPADDINTWFNTEEANFKQIINQLNSSCKTASGDNLQTQQDAAKVNAAEVLDSEPAEENQNHMLAALDFSMLDLFKMEAELQAGQINDNLLMLENDAENMDSLEQLMRSAHSIKGAARMIGFELMVDMFHRMEDCFVNAQRGKLNFNKANIDLLLQCNDILLHISQTDNNELADWLLSIESQYHDYLSQLTTLADQKSDTLSDSHITTNKTVTIENDSRANEHKEETGNITDQTTANESKVKIEHFIDLNLDLSMLDLFKTEAESQAQIIDENLLNLEQEPDNNSLLEVLMRASHSIKGAARMIGFIPIVDLAHKMEDCFVNTQKGKCQLNKNAIDLLLKCNDFLMAIPHIANDDIIDWLSINQENYQLHLRALDKLAANQDSHLDALKAFLKPGETPDQDKTSKPDTTKDTKDTKVTENVNRQNEASSIAKLKPEKSLIKDKTQAKSNNPVASVRIQSEQLNRMLAVSNEMVVSQQWMQTHLNELHQLKKKQIDLASSLTNLREILENMGISHEQLPVLKETEKKLSLLRQELQTNISEVDDYDRKSYILSSRLNREVISSRMRGFVECTHGFKRMVRDVSQALGKQVKLNMEGLDTLVDSDILDKIEAPLTHLIRNAIDHGIEMPEVRSQKGKSPEGLIKLSAYHNAGHLNITIKDDGRGVDLVQLKTKIINKGMINQQMADHLSESELLDFLFLPGFSTREDVTEFSGRGVGLDVVHSETVAMGGQIRSSSQIDQGILIQLQLPLTLSVIRSLLTQIGGAYYAFPLARIHAVIKKNINDIFSLEKQQFITFNEHEISLCDGGQILELKDAGVYSKPVLDIVVLSERGEYFAIVVDQIISEASLALHKIDPRLGKIKDISSAAIADDGKLVLVIDVDDLFISIQEKVNIHSIPMKQSEARHENHQSGKRVLVVDDSITIREVEKNLLESKGYLVDVAVDGADGWNSVRENYYDLVISDIDMPRMNGIEFVSLIKSDSRLCKIPVMIVSYKDNEQDKRMGLDAGADYYLTKGSFHDDTMIEAVIDLIGEST